MMNSADKIKMSLLAAMLAHDALELLTMNSDDLCRLQFRQIIISVKALEDHLRRLEMRSKRRSLERTVGEL